MSEFKTKVQQENEQEIFLLSDNPRLEDDLPVAIVTSVSKPVAIVKPKRLKSPYIETVLLFLCAIISIGADAFIFSSSLFSKIIADLHTVTTIIISIFCLIVHIVPEIYWGICIYKKAVRLGNYTIVLTNDKIIACGKANNTECTTIKLEDLVDIKQKDKKVLINAVNIKMKVELNNPERFVDLVQSLYNAL